MLSSGHNLEIARGVVGFIPVYVMHNLIRAQWPSKHFFGNNTVFMATKIFPVASSRFAVLDDPRISQCQTMIDICPTDLIHWVFRPVVCRNANAIPSIKMFSATKVVFKLPPGFPLKYTTAV